MIYYTAYITLYMSHSIIILNGTYYMAHIIQYTLYSIYYMVHITLYIYIAYIK